MSTPEVQQLSGDVSVCAQLDPSAMAWAARSGYKSIVNNRPDFEGGPDQPTSAAIEAAAKAAGLRYAHLPVQPGFQSPDEIEQFGKLIKELPKPVLAFCRSGTRSGKLYRAAVGQ